MTTDLGRDADLERFALRVRSWLTDNARPVLAGAVAGGGADLEEAMDFQHRLAAAGLAGITAPTDYGGQGLSAEHQRVFAEESARYHLPTGPLIIGLGMCAPLLVAVGTEEQRRRFLPPLLLGDEVWCQLLSEPDAGSDLANTKTTASTQGGDWVLNGEKVWTSGGHRAHFGVALARTDAAAAKHAGLSMFIVDMHAPGVTVRPIRQMNGGAEFDASRLEDVWVPSDRLLGGVGGGWTAVLTMLSAERVAVGGAGAGIGVGALDVGELIGLARARGRSADTVTRQELAGLFARQRLLGLVTDFLASDAGRVPAPLAGSVTKLLTTRLAKDLASAGTRIGGPASLAWEDTGGPSPWAQATVTVPSFSIGGGTDEIQKNVVAERVLGLPREARSTA